MRLELLFLLLCAVLNITLTHSRTVPNNINENENGIRIIGGINATRGEFPWMVSIQYNNFGSLRHICGGAILNETHVLTAGHCIYGINLANVLVVAGSFQLSAIESTRQTRTPNFSVVHARFENGGRTRNDIGLLEVNTFEFNDYVLPIPLPPQDHPARGNCIIAGWGQTSSSTSSDFLLKTTVPILNDSRCTYYYGSDIDTETQFCAGYDEGGHDFCTGDTGGPLLCNDTGNYYVAGIASWGYSCGQAQPGVYTEVSKYTSGLAPPVTISM